MTRYQLKNNNNTFEEFFNDFFNTNHNGIMNTDIIESQNEYEISIELPGFEKEDIKLSLENENLIVEAKKERKQEHSHYLHRERFYGTLSRSYYVGNSIKEEDIKASFKNGILTLIVPKKGTKEEVKKLINIQ